MYAGLGGANYPNWPTSSASGYANTAAQSLIAYAKANNLDGYDLDFENGLNADWVTQWTQIIPQLGVSHEGSACTLPAAFTAWTALGSHEDVIDLEPC